MYAISGSSEWALLVAQCLLGGAAVLLAVLLARRLTGSVLCGLVTGALVAFEPVQMTMPGGYGTEPLAMVLVMGAAYCAVRFVQSAYRPTWGVGFGLALAAATYVRPTTYYFALVILAVFVGWALWQRSQWRRLVGAGLIVAVPCMAVLGRGTFATRSRSAHGGSAASKE